MADGGLRSSQVKYLNETVGGCLAPVLLTRHDDLTQSKTGG